MTHLGPTWIDDERLAYNTPNGGHTGSARRGLVRFPDGTLHKVTLGIPDTFFTIPAHAVVKGQYVSGYVTIPHDNDEFAFIPNRPANEDKTP